MDKIFIKPTSKEILIKDSAKEGYLDIYSYDYNTDAERRKLGSLYIIGNVSQDGTEAPADEDTDIAYMVNLVASLAKREYYSKPDIPAKEAFSSTLQKINEIVEEFFKTKATRVNIGIFALAGEDILISKLGKFKILLSRDNEAIDVLNNISLFNKEHLDEKEFSNIISGKVQSGDKILAFYPSRFITSREKTIKDNFLKLSWTDFMDKINTIRNAKTAHAACAALYIDINKSKEPAVSPAPQPKELKKKAPLMSPDAQLISADSETDRKTSTAIELDKAELPPADVHSKEVRPEFSKPEPEPEIPKIIPSEFSSAKKENIFEKLISMFKSWKRRDSSFGRIGAVSWTTKFKKQAVVVLPALVLIAGLGWLAKSYVFVSAEQKEARRVAEEVKENIKLAENKMEASDPAGARMLLMSSLLNSALSSDAKEKMASLLDKADNAVLANPVMVESLPDEIEKKIEQFTLLDGNIKANKYGLSSPVISFDVYQDNLYILSGGKIFKVIDAAKGSETTLPWLKDNVSASNESVALAVDGNVFVLNKSGAIAKYYRGDKVYEKETSVYSEKSSLLTAKDIPNLYIVNEELGRIYAIDKESGSVIKVLKLGNTQPFTASWVDSAGVLYLGSSDGKIWKVE